MKNFTPLEELTVEALSSIEIHSTRASLERALGRGEHYIVSATDKLPTLYYCRTYDFNSGESIQTVHGLSSDLTRFLMLNKLRSNK